jgi:hypothetical protein
MMKSSLVKIGVVGLAMTLAACLVPASWIGVPVILGMVAMGCVALDG